MELEDDAKILGSDYLNKACYQVDIKFECALEDDYYLATYFPPSK